MPRDPAAHRLALREAIVCCCRRGCVVRQMTTGGIGQDVFRGTEGGEGCVRSCSWCARSQARSAISAHYLGSLQQSRAAQVMQNGVVWFNVLHAWGVSALWIVHERKV